MIFLLAALRAGIAGGSTEPAASPSPVELRDIAPPVDFFPWATWQIALAGAAGAVVLGLLIWWAVRHWPKRAAAPPPTPRQIALASLARLGEQVQALDAYAFSIAVSEVLRTFVEGQYRLRAREQTSPEFLAAIAEAPEFTAQDRELLGDFLERCDMIKFARAEPGIEGSRALLTSASAFVEGARS